MKDVWKVPSGSNTQMAGKEKEVLKIKSIFHHESARLQFKYLENLKMRTVCICDGKTYNLRKSQVSFLLKLFSDCKCGFSRNQSLFLQMRSSSGFETSSSEVVFCSFSCTKTEVTVNQLSVLRCARLLPPAGLERHDSTDQTDWIGSFSFL